MGGVSEAGQERDWYAARDMGGTVYPCTIVPSRYSGVYEGAPWLAFPFNYWDMPDGWDGGDVECAGFFAGHMLHPVGRGQSPSEAHFDLQRRLRSRPTESAVQDTPE